MALLPNINIGSAANDGTGDSIRDAFTIVNENFQFIEAFFPNSSVSNLVANITSTGTSTFNYLNANVINVATVGNAGTLITGNIVTAAQPNITSLGSLTDLTVSGNTSTSNLSVTSNTTIAGTLVTEGIITANTELYVSTNLVNFGESILSGNVTMQQRVRMEQAQYVNVTVVTANIVLGNNDYIIIANTAGNTNVYVTLPNAQLESNGRIINVVLSDISGNNDPSTFVLIQTTDAENQIVAVGAGLTNGILISNTNINSTSFVCKGPLWYQMRG